MTELQASQLIDHVDDIYHLIIYVAMVIAFGLGAIKGGQR